MSDLERGLRSNECMVHFQCAGLLPCRSCVWRICRRNVRLFIIFEHWLVTDVLWTSPFFDKVIINLPGVSKPLTIVSPGAANKPYIKNLEVNGRAIHDPVIMHEEIAKGGEITFTMSSTPEAWGSQTLVRSSPRTHSRTPSLILNLYRRTRPILVHQVRKAQDTRMLVIEKSCETPKS